MNAGVRLPFRCTHHCLRSLMLQFLFFPPETSWCTDRHVILFTQRSDFFFFFLISEGKMGCEMTIFVLSEYRPESIAIIWRQMCRWSSCYNSAQTKEATVRLICIQFLISAVQLSVISERNRRQRQHMNTAVAVGRGSSRPQHQYYIWRWFVNVPNENMCNVIILLHCVPVAFYLIVFVVLVFFLQNWERG